MRAARGRYTNSCRADGGSSRPPRFRAGLRTLAAIRAVQRRHAASPRQPKSRLRGSGDEGPLSMQCDCSTQISTTVERSAGALDFEDWGALPKAATRLPVRNVKLIIVHSAPNAIGERASPFRLRFMTYPLLTTLGLHHAESMTANDGCPKAAVGGKSGRDTRGRFLEISVSRRGI